jgi:hypothetical protein
MQKVGERHPLAKITEGDVRDMRGARARGDTVEAVYQSFGPRLGITFNTVRRILARVSWKHVD